MASKDLPTLSSDSLGYLEHLAFICSASYCYERIMDMTCGRPCRVIQNTFTPLKTFHSHLTESAAVVGILNYRDYPSTLVLVFRGSIKIRNWFLNFNHQLVPWKREGIEDNGEQVHRGFALAYLSLHNEIMTFLREYLVSIFTPINEDEGEQKQEMKEEQEQDFISKDHDSNQRKVHKIKDCKNSHFHQEIKGEKDQKIKGKIKKNSNSSAMIEKIVITGQSYGGALATLAAPDIVNLIKELREEYGEEKIPLDPSSSIISTSFSSPRVGNRAFVEYFKKHLKSGYRYRITVGNDPIVHFPMISQGYWHVPQEIFVGEDYLTYYCDKDDGEDENCSDGQKYPINFMDHAWFEGARFGAPCEL